MPEHHPVAPGFSRTSESEIRMNALLSMAVASVLLVASMKTTAQTGSGEWHASLADVRATAALIPGRRPLRINVVKFAESRRTKNFSVSGAPADPSVQARTAFQVVFADGQVMVDTGMDEQVHRFFGRGVEEPYDRDNAAQVERALTSARLIVVTHEHGDHVAGVVHSPRAAALAPKTMLTRSQLQTLIASPQMPEIKMTDELAARFIVMDYDRYFPAASGMVLIKAPGHTPGSQMVYVALDSGREYLLIGDVAWHMDGVRLVKTKNAPWITEDQTALTAQLTWLNQLSRSDPRLVIVASHDDEQRLELVRTGMLGGRFE